MSTSIRILQRTTDEPIEFLAFLIWYIFLVLCCLIPTCCAYRRRRIMEHRLAEQQATMQQRLQQSNLLFLSNFANDAAGPSLERVRTQLITDDLASTTMRLESHHFVAAAATNNKQQEAVSVSSSQTKLAGDGEINDIKEDIESQLDNSDSEEHSGFIRLQNNDVKVGDTIEQREDEARLVSDTCTICLCQYVEGESVTWSTRPECVHAFHTQCIISCKSSVLGWSDTSCCSLVHALAFRARQTRSRSTMPSLSSRILQSFVFASRPSRRRISANYSASAVVDSVIRKPNQRAQWEFGGYPARNEWTTNDAAHRYLGRKNYWAGTSER
jgi:hypothetical protein